MSFSTEALIGVCVRDSRSLHVSQLSIVLNIVQLLSHNQIWLLPMDTQINNWVSAKRLADWEIRLYLAMESDNLLSVEPPIDL